MTDKVRDIWHAVYCDEPTENDVAAAISFIEDQADYFLSITPVEKESDSGDETDDERRRIEQSRLEALASFCHALLSSNRFLYVD